MDEIGLLQELLAIPSVSGEEKACVRLLVERMTGLGFRAYRDGVGNAVGELGDPAAERSVLLLGHIDTVPGEIPVCRENGCLWGRGAVDAKGPLAAFVLAAARAAPDLVGTRLLVIGAVGEEAESRGARHLAEVMKPPDVVIIGEPGGWEGITLGYKGSLRVDYHLTRAAGHSAGDRTAPAEDAIAFWNRLADHAVEWNGDRSPPRFDTLDLTLRSIHSRGDGLQETAEMEVGLRVPPGLEVRALKQRMLGWAGQAKVTFPYQEPPYRAEKNTSVVRALLRAVRRNGGQPRFKLKTGTSDMNVVGPAWGCPMVAYGPGDSALDHTPDERICLAEFGRAVRVLVDALKDL